MGLLSGVGNIIGDVVDVGVDIYTAPFDLAYDIAGDVAQGVEATVKGALSGDPIAIASLAAMAYGAYSIYSAYAAASAGTAATTSAATTTTTTATTSTGAAGTSQAGVNQAFMDQVKTSLAQGSTTNTTNLAQVAGQKVVEEEVKKLTLNEVLKYGAKQAGTTLLTTAATSLLAKPSMDLPAPGKRSISESFNAAPTVRTGAGSTADNTGGISSGGGDAFDNVATLGRVNSTSQNKLRI